MGKSVKDSRVLRSKRVNLEVRANGDGTYDVFFNNKHVGNRVPEEWLDRDLCVNWGFCGEELRSIRDQLAASGHATMKLTAL
jgi:hypothetical protein